MTSAAGGSADVIVVGGGIIGTATAAFLAAAGARVVLVSTGPASARMVADLVLGHTPAGPWSWTPRASALPAADIPRGHASASASGPRGSRIAGLPRNPA